MTMMKTTRINFIVIVVMSTIVMMKMMIRTKRWGRVVMQRKAEWQ